jgi:hypothetical protein
MDSPDAYNTVVYRESRSGDRKNAHGRHGSASGCHLLTDQGDNRLDSEHAPCIPL